MAFAPVIAHISVIADPRFVIAGLTRNPATAQHWIPDRVRDDKRQVRDDKCSVRDDKCWGRQDKPRG